MKLTNNSAYDNKIVKQIDYDSFGNIIDEIYYNQTGDIITNPTQTLIDTLNIPIGFAGGLYDHHTKLTKFGYREYDSNIGRWITKDPIDFEGGDSNLYGYVVNDPINLIDPSGLASIKNPWEERISDYLGLCDKNGNFDCSIINNEGGKFCTKYVAGAMYPCRQAMSYKCEMKGIKCWNNEKKENKNETCDR
jgi:RHS repeat-associated protein